MEPQPESLPLARRKKRKKQPKSFLSLPMDWSSYQANVCPLMLIAHHPPKLLLISAITPRPQTKGMSLNPSRNYVLTAVFRAPHYTKHFTEQLLTSQPAAVPDEAELRPPRSAPRGGAGQTAGAGGHPLRGPSPGRSVSSDALGPLQL